MLCLSGFEPYSRWVPLFNALWSACVVDEIEDYRDYFREVLIHK